MPDTSITVGVEIINLEEVKQLRKELERIKELKKEIQELEKDDDDTSPLDPNPLDPNPFPRPKPDYPKDPVWIKGEESGEHARGFEADEDILADATFEI